MKTFVFYVLAYAMLFAPLWSAPLLPGSGTLEDPYQISNVTELQSMWEDLNAHYVLTADIDASATASWNEDPQAPGTFRGFDPVGDIIYQIRFRGSLDGRGHVISGLFINRSAEARVGLFGYLSEEAVVQNLGIVDANITGGQRTGILAGENHGFVTRVFTTGEVSGAWATGGLVGENHQTGVIENVYAHANVLITGYGGGLVGSNQGQIRWAFSTGEVAGPPWAGGGLVGQVKPASQVSLAYWDVESSGLATSEAGEGKTTAELLELLSYAAWDMATPDTYEGQTWILLPGEDYPSFGWQTTPSSPTLVTLAGSFSVYDKLKDGTHDAVISQNSLVLLGVSSDDDVHLDAEARFLGTETGDHQVVLSETTRLAGADAHKYQLSLDGAPDTSAEILPLKIRLLSADPSPMRTLSTQSSHENGNGHPRVKWEVPSLPNGNGRVFHVQRASCLKVQDWQTMGTVAPATGELVWTSPEPANGNAFFRVVYTNATEAEDS